MNEQLCENDRYNAAAQCILQYAETRFVACKHFSGYSEEKWNGKPVADSGELEKIIKEQFADDADMVDKIMELLFGFTLHFSKISCKTQEDFDREWGWYFLDGWQLEFLHM